MKKSKNYAIIIIENENYSIVFVNRKGMLNVELNYPGSLHNHSHRSNYRLKDCIIKEEELIDRAVELGHEVVAFTDHETISVAVKVEKIYKKIKEKNIPLKIIIGNEIYLCRDGLNSENFVPKQDEYYHFILLACDRIGFQQLCELSTRAWNRSYVARGMRRVPTYYSDLREIIGSNPGHVIGSSACLGGMLARQLIKYRDNPSNELWSKILNWCNLMCSLFGGNEYFYLELQPSATKEQTYVNRKLIEISELLNIKYIITCDSHYLKAEDRIAHKAYLKSQNGEREIDAFYATTYLMDTEDLINHLDLTDEELKVAFDNIRFIKNKCEDYSILKPLKIPTLKWKDYSNIEVNEDWIRKIPYFNVYMNSNYNGDRTLVKAIIDGIQKHPDLQNEEAYREINNNLETTWISSEVNKAHWSAYFLNLQKIIELCWEAGSIVGPGRGSGVGFLLLYCLDITQINPLRETTKCFPWRFLNPERVSVLDVDFDIEGRKRDSVLKKFREFYGEDRVANVTTLKTEQSKSAILSAARGLGIDNDIAQYLASLVTSDRGQLRTLKDTYYGNSEKGFEPNHTFIHEMTDNYPELWEVAQKIEGLICGTGIHAGGVIFVDEPFTNSTALMRAPNGTIVTQFDLHESEDVSLIKYDALSVEAMDKIHICLDLLVKHNHIKKENTLKETYEKAIGVYNLERDNLNMWKMIWEHKIISLFQMEKQSGIKGIALIKPKNINDLSVLNSVIRLMAPDENSKAPLDMWDNYRKSINLWIQEMRKYGLTKDEIDWLSHHSAITDGICESQEGLMSLVQEDRLGGNSLTFADKCRKGIAKKQGRLFQECEDIFYDNIKKKNCSEKLAHYVWDVLLRVQRGYSFNRSHCLAYSLVALQEMNLAFKYPIIYWNSACLISDSGSETDEAVIEEENKAKGTDYGKIAKAIGEIKSQNIEVSLVDINKSSNGFEIDEENNRILFGLKGLSRVNDVSIEKIKAGRPYTGIKDFIHRCPLSKSVMLSLIKAGAFDELDAGWASKLNPEPRIGIMIYYLSVISEPKKRLTLQNLAGLFKSNLIPQDFDFQKKVYEFNKYLKALNKSEKTYYIFNDACQTFYEKNFNIEKLEVINGNIAIKQKEWEKIYKEEMDKIKKWINENQQELLHKYNETLFLEIWNKYCESTIAAWEMESCCFYYHPHELKDVDVNQYGLSNFFELPFVPEVEYYFKRGGREIPIYKLTRIVGTILSKDELHSSLSVLTPQGVITVKFTKEYYANYKKRISQINPDGTKTVIEDGWFKRGNKILVTGFRREDTFVAKSYAATPTYQLYLITSVSKDGKTIELEHDRADIA